MMDLQPLKHTWRSWVGTIEQYDELVKYFENVKNIVSFTGTRGKYCFDKRIVYPRYKVKKTFEKYNEDKALSLHRSIAKNEKYANYIVFDVKPIIKILKEAFTDTLKDSDKSCKIYRYLNKGEAEMLKDAYELATTHSHVSIIPVEDFLKEMTNYKERLSLRDSEMLVNLLKGDDAALKLGMEMMTNYDVKKSLLALIYASHSGRHLSASEYFTSTAFKSFRKEFLEACGFGIENIKYSGNIFYLLKRIGLDNIYMDSTEITIVKQFIYKEIENYISGLGITIKLNDENLELNINSERIIIESPEIVEL